MHFDVGKKYHAFCGSELGYRTKSRRGCLILVVDTRLFAVAVHTIAESRVTSTIGTCYSMSVRSERMLDAGTFGLGRNTLGHTDTVLQQLARGGQEQSPRLGLLPDQLWRIWSWFPMLQIWLSGLQSWSSVVTALPSQFNAASYLDFWSLFMRFETEGVKLWNFILRMFRDHLVNSPNRTVCVSSFEMMCHSGMSVKHGLCLIRHPIEGLMH